MGYSNKFKKIKSFLINLTPERLQLKKLYKIFARSPEGEWIIGWKECLKIYHIIKIRNCKNVLELGTGIGTAAAVMANALGPDGRVTTIEQNEKCLRLAKETIPEKLSKKINFVYSEATHFTHPILTEGERISGYKMLPLENGPFDFVLVDGPGAWEENGNTIRYPNGDIFNLIHHIIPGGIVFIDCRKTALNLYLKYLQPYFIVRASWRTYCFLERTNK